MHAAAAPAVGSRAGWPASGRGGHWLRFDEHPAAHFRCRQDLGVGGGQQGLAQVACCVSRRGVGGVEGEEGVGWWVCEG